jgi:hypothetical protein
MRLRDAAVENARLRAGCRAPRASKNLWYASSMMMNSSEFDAWLCNLRDNERGAQVELLIALIEFDRKEIYLELGYDSLWTYCMKRLHLCEGSTYLRTRAVAIVRRFPPLAAHLRDGRLSLTTLVKLEPLLDDASVDEITARAAYMSKTEVERLIATLREPATPLSELTFRRAPVKASSPAPTAEVVTPPTTAPAMSAPKRTLQAEPVAQNDWLIRGRL